MRLLVDALEHWAKALPRRTAYLFLKDGEQEAERIDFADLSARTHAVAAALQSRFAPGDRALLVYRPGIEFMVGFLGALRAGLVAVPVPAPEPLRPVTRERLLAIIADAQPAVALTDLASRDELQLPHIVTAELPAGRAGGFSATGDTLALLQYTSGSTTSPRGVMISHGNLWHNSAAIAALEPHTPDSVVVSWLPHFHDMGLIGGLLPTVHSGALGVLFAPSAFLRRPLRWLEAITRYRATSTPIPNAALELCLRRRRAVRGELELSSLAVLCNGSEPIRAETLARFNEAFGPFGLSPSAHLPVYGLAEATLLASGGPGRSEPRLLQLDGGVRVGCGRPLGDLSIVDPERNALPEDRVGEIWLRGPSVAQGYWRRERETEELFGARLADGSGPFLRTGDRGFLHQGELFIAGRIKNLIIVAGRNLHAEDVEHTIESNFPSVRRGGVAAFAVEEGGEEKLVVAVEWERSGGDPLEAIRAIADRIRQAHEAPVHAVRLLAPGALPRTSSGKLQRHECAAAFLAGEWNA
jgi:acyl-CoA synthetase (AMP-forming)/AMP-acid ligase II